MAGKTFELHCQAQGHPEPVLSWQKDGGTSFPAADDRRMDFLPDSKVYVIRNAQPGDTGKYTCSAENEAGFVNATAFVTVLGKRQKALCVRTKEQPRHVTIIQDGGAREI